MRLWFFSRGKYDTLTPEKTKEWSIMAFLALILVSGGIVVVGCLDERRRRN